MTVVARMEPAQVPIENISMFFGNLNLKIIGSRSTIFIEMFDVDDSIILGDKSSIKEKLVQIGYKVCTVLCFQEITHQYFIANQPIWDGHLGRINTSKHKVKMSQSDTAQYTQRHTR